MDDLTIWKIRYKYNNLIFPNIPNLLIIFLMNNINYLDMVLSKDIHVKDIIYYLRNKKFHTGKELIDLVIRYIEMRYGIFK